MLALVSWSAVVARAAEKEVLLSWLPSASPGVIGYRIYYGSSSGRYANRVDAGNSVSGSVCCLAQGQTYYFAVTAYLTSGEESDYSEEITYRIKDPINATPKLNSIADFTLNENDLTQSIVLSGIQPATSTGTHVLKLTAKSSAPSLIPDPTIAYNNPDRSGTLYITPARGQSGTATITVTVEDRAQTTNRLSQSFQVTVSPINDPPYLDPIADLTLVQGAGLQTIMLGGISAGAANESQPISLSAISSDPSLIPHPTINYVGPNSFATLSFDPKRNVSGIATISITVDDGQPIHGRFSREFQVEIIPPTTNQYLIEAETSLIMDEMELGASSTASGGSFAFSRIAETGTVEMSVSIGNEANYALYARMFDSDSGNNSFYVSVDQGDEMIYSMEFQPRTGNWQWIQLRDWTLEDDSWVSTPRLLRLSKGQHTLRFRTREAFSILDAIRLTQSNEGPAPQLAPNVVSDWNLEYPWVSSSIGRPDGGQSVAVGSGSFTMTSPGGLQGQTDTCLFISQEANDDSQITVLLDLPSQLGEGGFAGIMMREDLGSRSVYAALGASSNRALQWNIRQRPFEDSTSTIIPIEPGATRCWLHMRRSEDTISSYASFNGVVWFPVETTQLLLRSSTQVGLVYASGTSPVTATVSDVVVEP